MGGVVGASNQPRALPCSDDATEIEAQTDPTVSYGSAIRVRLQPQARMPGTRYRIERWVGETATGVVYEAVHEDLGRKVAIKVLHPEHTEDARTVATFRKEAQTASRIGSPYIVEVSDFAELPDGRWMYVMERLPGVPLEVEVERAPMEPGRLIAILRQICKGLVAAHDEGLVHRDLKPETIRLLDSTERSTAGRSDAVKLMDFGVAAMAGSKSGSGGTPAYMAPEAIMGMGTAKQSDIYALGCIAYELLCGQPPFVADSPAEVLRRHLRQEPEPPSKRVGAKAAPPPLERVILQCLAKKRRERPADMRHLEAALCHAQLEAGLTTGWDDLELPRVDPQTDRALAEGFERLRARGSTTAPRRRRWPMAAAAMGLTALLAAVAVPRFVEGAPEPGTHDRIEILADDVRDAAARALFVYPPPEAPEETTAYRALLELESSADELGEHATQRARSLRTELADTLEFLGDRYWGMQGGRAFAIDYYAQALLFDPSRPKASERGGLTPGQLAELRRKADAGEFSEIELVVAEPLAVMADPDEDSRNTRLAQLVARTDRHRSSTVHARLETLLDDLDDPQRTRPRRRPDGAPTSPEPVPVPVPTDESADAPALEAASDSEDPDADRPKAAPRSPTRARQIAADGRAALRRGEFGPAETLFHNALEHDRSCGEALMGLADVHFERAEHGKAVTYAEKAIRVAPRHAGYRLKLGDAYFKVLRYEDARTQYTKASELGHSAAQTRLHKLDQKVGR